MSRKEKKLKHSSVNSGVIIYTDNVTDSFTASGGFEDILKYDATSLNLPRNTSDPDFFKKLDSEVVATGGIAIVITADTGKEMMETISNYKERICTITVKIPGKDKQKKAIETLFKTTGFKIYSIFTKKYSRISLTQAGSALSIECLNLRGKSSKKILKKNVF